MNRADGMIYHQALTQAAATPPEGFLISRGRCSELARSPRENRSRFERQLKAFGTTSDTLAQKVMLCLRRCDLRARIRAPLKPRNTPKGRA